VRVRYRTDTRDADVMCVWYGLNEVK